MKHTKASKIFDRKAVKADFFDIKYLKKIFKEAQYERKD